MLIFCSVQYILKQVLSDIFHYVCVLYVIQPVRLKQRFFRPSGALKSTWTVSCSNPPPPVHIHKHVVILFLMEVLKVEQPQETNFGEHERGAWWEDLNESPLYELWEVVNDSLSKHCTTHMWNWVAMAAKASMNPVARLDALNCGPSMFTAILCRNTRVNWFDTFMSHIQDVTNYVHSQVNTLNVNIIMAVNYRFGRYKYLFSLI